MQNYSQAVETRHALHGIRWPQSNPKCLNVEFGQESSMEDAVATTAGDSKSINTARDERHISTNDVHDSRREKVCWSLSPHRGLFWCPLCNYFI